MKTVSIVAAFAAAALAGVAVADVPPLATLNAKINVDNAFDAYISDSATTLGTKFLSGDNWQVNFAGSFDLTQAGTYYIHVVATDLGGPRMFIGAFSLANGSESALFGNGTTQLFSNATDWSVRAGSLSGAEGTILDQGTVGDPLPWAGSVTGATYTTASRFIWHSDVNSVSTAVFTSTILVVPGPMSASVLAAACVGFARRRR